MIQKRPGKKHRTNLLSGLQLFHKVKASRLTSGMLWSTGANIIIKLRGFLIVILISQHIGIEWYGAYSLIYALASYGVIISTLSLPNAVIRFLPEEPQGSNIFVFVFVLTTLGSLLITLPILLFAEEFASLFLRDSTFSELVFCGAFLVILHSMQLTIQDYYRARENLELFSLVQVIFPIVELLALSIGVFIARDVVTGLKLYLSFASLLIVIPIMDILRHNNLQGVFGKQNVLRLRTYLQYALPLVPTSFTSLIASNGDRFLIGFLLGAEAVGYYGAVYALASVIMLFNSPITNVLFPRVSKLYFEGDVKAIRFYVRIGIAAFLAVGIASFILYAFLGDEFLFMILNNRGYLTGERTRELQWMLFVLTIALVLYGSFRIFSLHLFVLNKTVSLFWIYLSTAIANVLFVVLLVPSFGLVGAANATLLAYGVSGLLIWLHVRASYQRRYAQDRGGAV